MSHQHQATLVQEHHSAVINNQPSITPQSYPESTRQHLTVPQFSAPLMSNTIHGTPLPPGPTPVRYAHSDSLVLPPTAPVAYSTVSFPLRPYKIANVIQPQLDSFQHPPAQLVPSSYTGQYIHSDTVYSDPASENRNRYAKAREQPTRHAQRRERPEYRDHGRHLFHLSDLETSDSTRPSLDPRALQDQARSRMPPTTSSHLATVSHQ